MVWRAGSIRLPGLLASVLSPRRAVTHVEGMSLIEVLVGCGLLSVLLGMTVPIVLTTRADWSVRAAARYVASQAMLVRAEAVRRGTAVGLRFESTAEGCRFGSFVDGDGDGIRTTDIAEGVDVELRPAERLADHFPSVIYRPLIARTCGYAVARPTHSRLCASATARCTTRPLTTFTPFAKAGFWNAASRHPKFATSRA